MHSVVLVTWLGGADLKAARGELGDELGPIGQAVRKRPYAQIHLLSDHSAQDGKQYQQWLRKQSAAEISVHRARLSGPTEFAEIYESAVELLRKLRADLGDNAHFVYHLSPGTPAMAAVWILLAKTIYPAELIESSARQGVRTVDPPFEIAADYLPAIAQPSADEIVRLTQGLPPQVAQFEDIVHRCEPMKRLVAQARRIAVHDVPVLIQGESGTGKELFARAIHASSARSKGPFIDVNCGAIPQELVEGEFFGYKKGSFTGADQTRAGYLEAADGGTLFLDEIGELPLSAQVKLLRALQEKAVQKIGTTRSTKVDFRVVAATNRILLDEVAAQRFREDLFHRIAVGVLQVPPLRTRTGDLGLLVDCMLERVNKDLGKHAGWVQRKLSAGARSLLLAHPWPGNVRELDNTLSRAAIWTTGETINANDVRNALFPVTKHLPAAETILNRALGSGFDLEGVLAEVARHYLKRADEEAHGNSTAASKLVGLPSYQTFNNWKARYGVNR